MRERNQKILLIDDDAALRRTITKRLWPVGFEILECDNGDEGIQLARLHSPDLIISDVNMERGDGYSVLTRLREDPLLASIPLILMTGHADDAGLRRGMERGADDYLAKPFTLEALMATIEARLLRRQAESSTQELLLKTLAATTDLVCVIRLQDRHILHLNQSGRKLVGFGAVEKLDSLKLEKFYPLKIWAIMRDVAIPAAVVQGVWSGETHLLTRDRREIPVSQVLIIHADRHGKPEHMSVVARDLSERIQAEQNLAASYAQLRELTGRMVSVQEAERGRIAREIHDEFGQQLTAFNTDLSWMEKRVRESKMAARDQWSEKIAAMQSQIKTTIQTVRRIAKELRPALLDSLGLIAALEWQAKDFQTRTGVRCDLQCEMETLDWDSDRSIALFRIFQEALTNVTRHAQARSVRASLTHADGTVRLVVQDDGLGISDTRHLERKSLGLLGMKERAFLVGGTLQIASQPGGGTMVEVKIPFNQTIS